MKNYILIILFTFECSVGLSQGLQIHGNQHIRDLNEIIPEIKNSIEADVNNLNLYEYAYALPELLYFLKSENNRKRWLEYLKHWGVKVNDTTTNEYYSSVDPLVLRIQSSFFLETLYSLDSNQVKSDYQNALKFLVKAADDLYATEEFSIEVIKTALKISDQKGKTNFWYFFQVFDCSFLEQIVAADEIVQQYFDMSIDGYEIISTYKIPYQLQKLKWKGIQQRLEVNSNCNKISALMNSREIGIFDNVKDFYSESSKEGIDRLQQREF